MNHTINKILSTQFIGTVLIIIAAAVVILLLNHCHRKIEDKAEPMSKTVAAMDSAFRAARFIVVMLAVFTVLDINNINVRSLIAGVGVAGAVVGIAMQDILKDAMMGFHIINDRSFSVGDVIKIGDDEGTVTQFGLLSTQYVSSNTGNKVTVCNRSILQVERVAGIYDIDLGVSYEEKAERVADILTTAAENIANIHGIHNAKYLGIQRYEDSAVIYKLRFWCSPKKKWPMYRAAMSEVQKSVDGAELKIPYPQIEIHGCGGNK